MSAAEPPPLGLDLSACRRRQQRLVELLPQIGVRTALLVDRRHIHYFTGCWGSSYHRPLLSISADGEAILAAPAKPDAIAAEVVEYEWRQLGTLIDDPAAAGCALTAASPARPPVGVDQPWILQLAEAPWVDLTAALRKLRRAKDPDEVALVRRAIAGCQAAYEHAATLLAPGVREIDLFAEMQAAVVKEVGEPIGELGNDFQAGTGGGPPRRRKVEAGELMPLDVSVVVRGYRCDLCRTFVVGGDPSPAQSYAAAAVLHALEAAEQACHVGAAARELYALACNNLQNVNGWTFPHHLGHGIGLDVHEAPRLNPHWSDTLQLGDLFTLEPGLYADELRGGVRIEDNYWLTAAGLERLSSFPRDLVRPLG